MNGFVEPAQMVNRLLGQGGRSSEAQAEASAPAVSPGDIGIICFHRAQVGRLGLSCSCHGPKSAVWRRYLLSTHNLWTGFGTTKSDSCACRWP